MKTKYIEVDKFFRYTSHTGQERKFLKLGTETERDSFKKENGDNMIH